jgi:hypothetical protein
MKAPAGLGPAGKRLWLAIVGSVVEGWELDAKDLALLESAATTADTVESLSKELAKSSIMVAGSMDQDRLNPLVAEIRQQKAAQAALLKQVQLAPPSPATGRLNRRQRNQMRDEGSNVKPLPIKDPRAA